MTFSKRGVMSANQRGFTLIEVMIALAIFGVFITAFVSGQGGNLLDSTAMREEQVLFTLANNKLSEIKINPPEFSETLTSNVDTKTFEDYENYEWSVEFKKFEIPEYNAATGQEEVPAEQEMQKRIYTRIKDNMEKMLWQVRVTVKNKTTGQFSALSTWIQNDKATVRFQY